MDRISFKPISDIGLVRDSNEDSFIAEPLWSEHHLLFAVIDGVGGYEGGEVAAELARSSIITFLHNYPDNNLQDVISQAVLQANNCIYEHRKQGQFPHMGCVVSAAIIDTLEDKLYIAHVGDTRIYLYNKGTLTKLTHDHSLVGYREEIGELTEEEAMNHPRRNIIERYLGDEERVFGEGNFIDSAVYTIPAGGKLLFCSDGLTDLVKSVEIKQILALDESTALKSQRLVNLAKEHGGTDNITVVLVETHSDIVSQKEETLYCKPDRPEIGSPIHKSGNNAHRWLLPLVASLLGFLIGFSLGRKCYYAPRNTEIAVDTIIMNTNNKDSVVTSQCDSVKSEVIRDSLSQPFVTSDTL